MDIKPQKPVKSPQGDKSTKSGKWIGGRPISLRVENPEYVERKTANGVVREFTHETGQVYREFTSHATLFGMPMIHRVRGISPETGKVGVAEGFIAIGQWAKGVIAIGQMVNGYFAVGQVATGRVAAIGQVAVAPIALGQFTIAVVGAGQMVAALIGAGQVGAVGFGAFQVAYTLFGGVAQELHQLF